eukprot:TRINITY_DN26833_c0_g1_i1.p1 TRINITY_DN26833_c0_g1~~TRINITY_DN26833_c0_g1_i1.p1  ORF type:complete len:363 (+),score=90.78 TRINITY_DN26833_c0_g1_i1:41-1129(+)
MRHLCLLALLPMCNGYITTSWRDLQSNTKYSFSDYLSEYSKVYSDASEYKRREALFHANVASIRRHNAGDSTYKMGLNMFTDLDEQERAAARGRAQSRPSYAEAPSMNEELPTQVDWRATSPPVLTPIKNQGACGSCWAFSTTESIESALARETGKLMVLSPQQLVSCAPNPMACGGTGGCGGSTQPLGFNYTIGAGGLSAEASYPYRSGGDGITGSCNKGEIKPAVNIKGWIELPVNNASALMAAVATIGPIAISADARNWHSYEEGVFNACGYEVDHCIQLVGYGTTGSTSYWIVRNSWGPSYGEEGYIRILRTPAGEPCGMDKKPQEGLACKNQTEPLKYCGTCGILSGSSYPTGAFVV